MTTAKAIYVEHKMQLNAFPTLCKALQKNIWHSTESRSVRKYKKVRSHEKEYIIIAPLQRTFSYFFTMV